MTGRVRGRQTLAEGEGPLDARSGVVEAAASKVFQTDVCQAIARLAQDFGGPAALADGARVSTLWRQSLWESTGGGTSEIMRGVVARQGLGLGA